jgi:DNA-binding transcriptional regulator YhcF (GntR family)
MEVDKQGELSPLEFRLDARSGVPTYLQLVQQVESALRLGHLVPGDRLPKVKEVVAALAINPNTVLKAYRELELRGLASGRRGQGTFVQAAPGIAPVVAQQALRRRLDRWLDAAAAAGLDEAAMAALFTSRMHELRRRDAAGSAEAEEAS